jgi:uncharacterized membrane protein YqjE
MALTERRDAAPSAVAKDALQRLIDGFQTLVREHLALAKIELKDDLRRLGRNAALSAAGVPALFVGYVLLMVSVALLLALALPTWLAFLIVAVLNLAAGGLLTAVFGNKARNERLALPRTAEELKRDRQWIASMGNGSVPREPAMEPLAEGRTSPQRAGEASSVSRTHSESGVDANRDAAEDMDRARGAPPLAGPIPASEPHRDALPAGKAGATPSLDPRSDEPTPGHPVAGATSTPDGEPMMAERRDVTH